MAYYSSRFNKPLGALVRGMVRRYAMGDQGFDEKALMKFIEKELKPKLKAAEYKQLKALAKDFASEL